MEREGVSERGRRNKDPEQEVESLREIISSKPSTPVSLWWCWTGGSRTRMALLSRLRATSWPSSCLVSPGWFVCSLPSACMKVWTCECRLEMRSALIGQRWPESEIKIHVNNLMSSGFTCVQASFLKMEAATLITQLPWCLPGFASLHQSSFKIRRWGSKRSLLYGNTLFTHNYSIKEYIRINYQKGIKLGSFRS